MLERNGGIDQREADHKFGQSRCNLTYLFCCGGHSQMRLIDLHCEQTGLQEDTM